MKSAWLLAAYAWELYRQASYVLKSVHAVVCVQGPVTSFEEALSADTAKFARFHRGMLEEGVYLAPSQVGMGQGRARVE